MLLLSTLMPLESLTARFVLLLLFQSVDYTAIWKDNTTACLLDDDPDHTIHWLSVYRPKNQSTERPGIHSLPCPRECFTKNYNLCIATKKGTVLEYFESLFTLIREVIEHLTYNLLL